MCLSLMQRHSSINMKLLLLAMTAKYSRLPQDETESPENLYASPFNYDSIYTYNKKKTFESPYTYTNYGKSDIQSVEFDKNLSGSFPRNVVETIVIALCYVLFVMTLPMSLLVSLRFVSQYERLVVFRLGRLLNAKGPGAVLILPCIDSTKRVDLRTKAFNVPPLQAVTGDGGVIEFGASVFYRVKDVMASVLQVQDFNKALRNLAHSVVHRLVNRYKFEQLTKDKKLLGDQLKAELNKAALSWGMEVGNIEIADMRTIRQPEPASQNALRTLMQPQVMKQLWQNVTGGQTMPLLFNDADLKSAETVPPEQQQLFSPSQYNPVEPAPPTDLETFLGFMRQCLTDSMADEIGHAYNIRCRNLGDFYLHLKRPVCLGVGQLQEEMIDVTIELERSDLIDLMSEKLSPLDGYLSGKISITGDTNAAMRMQPLATKMQPLLRASALSSSFRSA